MPSSAAFPLLLVRLNLCWGLLLLPPVFAARLLGLLPRRPPAAAALTTAFCPTALFASFALLLSRPISLPCLTVDTSPTSLTRPFAPTVPTRLRSQTQILRPLTSNALLGPSRHNAKTIASVLGTIACKRRRMPFWRSLPLATTNLMIEALVSCYLAGFCLCFFLSIS